MASYYALPLNTRYIAFYISDCPIVFVATYGIISFSFALRYSAHVFIILPSRSVIVVLSGEGLLYYPKIIHIEYYNPREGKKYKSNSIGQFLEIPGRSFYIK